MAKKSDENPPKAGKVYEVRLKVGHPHGRFHRAGYVFTTDPMLFEGEVPAAIAADPWLVVTEVPQ